METKFTIKEKTIVLKNFDDYIDLWCWGDVHRDASSCDVDRWKWFLNRASKCDPEKTWYLGFGDYHDFASAGEETKIKAANLHETTMETIELGVSRQLRKFAIEIKQMNGRLLGLLDGNHNWRMTDGRTSTEHLADMLGTEYLGWLCHYTLNFLIGTKTQNVYLIPCHGKAGGKLLGTSINQVDDLRRVFPAADLYIQGHDHKRAAFPTSVLIPTSGHGITSLKQKRQYICRSGSFKKGYTDGMSSYEVGRLYSPSDLGALKFRIQFHRDCKDDQDRVITDITAEV